ncbi:HDOD domain-containing protein [Rhodoferax sp.]|uniref:HDOD domain-containing protein n=1 Tax=Rhodoferax sp. TaxID=50421 RepID=UPI0025E305D0|nr:HDOD domain-containing protein [Rhodoferax sp.]
MRTADIDREIETARTEGPLKDIVIQPCPALLSDLRVEVNREDPEPATIARIASRDVAMAAALIKVANSPIYARSRPAATVAEAVALLGISQTVSILTGFLLRETIRVKSPLLEHFWETSTRRAYAMGYIARQMYGVNADIAHTCGLFCNVGIPVMLQGLKGYEATLTDALAQSEKTVTEMENAAHRTDHAVVGAIVAKTWRLSPDVAHAVRLHHDFTVLKDDNIPAKVRTLVAMALLAEHLVAQHEGAPVQREWELHGTECLAHLHVSEEEIEHWLDALHEQFIGPAGF